MNYDNPAARLLLLLKQGKQIDEKTPCQKAWAQILSTKTNLSLLLSRLGKVMELSQVTVQVLQDRFPEKGNMWLHWCSQVNQAFSSQNLKGTWDSFINKIDGHAMNYLEMCSELLQLTSTTKSITDEEIQEVQKKLEEILQEISETEIDSAVKEYVIRYIRKIITSLDEYYITGALPILESVEITIGHIHIDKNYKEFLTKTDLGKKILDTLHVTASAVTLAVGLPEIGNKVIPLLS